MTVADVGVAIVTYNSAAEIGDCLAALTMASRAPLQIVVVDNASQDQTLSIVHATAPHVMVIPNSSNRYYAAASNQGIAAIDAPFVLLLNPDAAVPPGGVDALRQFLERHPDAAAVAPRLIGPDGRRQPSLRELPGLDTLWYDFTGLSVLFPRSRIFGRWRMGYFNGAQERIVPQPMASCLLVRREVFTEIGGFDESYPMFFNDVDWCRRTALAGLWIYYTPEVSVRHTGGAAVNRRKVRMIWMSHYAYFVYLHRLYATRPLMRALVWISAPALFASAIVRSVWWGPLRRMLVGRSSYRGGN
ncbi:MAG: glycosyltransferase family 2 protein [Candidatus Zixiibacteriota bacterium]